MTQPSDSRPALLRALQASEGRAYLGFCSILAMSMAVSFAGADQVCSWFGTDVVIGSLPGYATLTVAGLLTFAVVHFLGLDPHNFRRPRAP